MNALGEAVAALAHDLHPDVAISIAKSIEDQPDKDVVAILRGFLGGTGKAHLSTIANLLTLDDSIVPRDIASMLRGAAATISLISHERSELVWTGPDTGIVPIRKTEQVLIGLIEESRHELFMVSFVAYGATAIMQALANATSRGVKVRILMELSQADGGTLNFDAISKVQKAVPKAEVFTWGGTEDGRGSVHAKCAVADGESAFITSANLTGAAMQQNMELGSLFYGGAIPLQLQKHLKALVMTHRISQVVK